jgi:hypothetical protein
MMTRMDTADFVRIPEEPLGVGEGYGRWLGTYEKSD